MAASRGSYTAFARNGRRDVLDASVLIAYLDNDDSHHVAAEKLLAEAVDDDLGVNPLTLAEVLAAPARDGLLDDQLAQTAQARNLPIFGR